ncbi:trigger factor [Lachnoclostridium sp. An14]|nr:trigger factor [Lachnoclostridium sp. An14]
MAGFARLRGRCNCGITTYKPKMRRNIMRKFAKLCVCGVAAALVLASGCGKKQEEADQTTAEETTAVSGEVELGQYKGVELEKTDASLTDEEFQTAVDARLEANPDWIEVERPAQNGDTVNIDYVGMRDGEAFEGGTDQGYDLVLGSGSFIDGFEDGLIGAVKGQELSLELTFPDPYRNNPDLAGQPVVFDVTVNRVEEPRTPELNDAFVQRISDFDTVDAWETDLRSQLEEQKAQQAESQDDFNLYNAIMESSTFTGIDESVDAELNRLMEMNESLMALQGVTLEDYLAAYGLDQEVYETAWRSQAEYNVKMELMLKAVAEQENLEITDEIKQEVADMNGMEDYDSLVEAAGNESEAERLARNYAAMKFLKDNAVYK